MLGRRRQYKVEEEVSDVCDAITHNVRHRGNMAMNGGMLFCKLVSKRTYSMSIFLILESTSCFPCVGYDR